MEKAALALLVERLFSAGLGPTRDDARREWAFIITCRVTKYLPHSSHPNGYAYSLNSEGNFLSVFHLVNNVL